MSDPIQILRDELSEREAYELTAYERAVRYGLHRAIELLRREASR